MKEFTSHDGEIILLIRNLPPLLEVRLDNLPITCFEK